MREGGSVGGREAGREGGREGGRKPHSCSEISKFAGEFWEHVGH